MCPVDGMKVGGAEEKRERAGTIVLEEKGKSPIRCCGCLGELPPIRANCVLAPEHPIDTCRSSILWHYC